MSDKLSEQKCPACGAPLRFDPISGKSVCDFCGSSFDIADEGEIGEGGSRKDQALSEELPIYNCESCGAEIITEAVSASVQCPYCGNNIVLTEKIEGGLRPDGLIPFRFDKSQLPDEVRKFYKNKWLLPRRFFSESSLEDVTGVYVPFWLFDEQLSGRLNYDCWKDRSYRDGDYDVTEHKHYDVVRDVSMSFENVPANASVRLDDKLMESVEPFDYSGLKPFGMSYLSGFCAERFDKGADEVKTRAEQRMESTAYSVSDDRARSGYTGCRRESGKLGAKGDKSRYMLLPVYTFGVKWKDKRYDFAMNGQTGKVVGELPPYGGKAALLWLAAFAVTFGVSFLLGWLISGEARFGLPLIIAGIVSLIFTLIVASNMRTVRSASSAGNYLVGDSVKVVKIADRFTRTTEDRTLNPEKNARG